MGSPLLVLRLEGPLQSWGLRARWDVRDSADEPSKSGVIGLLGCAFGYPSGDERLVRLDEALSMGVRIERQGLKLTDFQTISGVIPTAEGKVHGKPDAPHTVISPRTYLQDAAFLVVLAGPVDVLERCRVALVHPRWPVYLGRKSCVPTRPVFAELTDRYDDLEDALRRIPWEWTGFAGQESELRNELVCVVEDPQGDALRPDGVAASPVRMYRPRVVRVFSVPFPGLAARKEGEACTSPGSP